MISTRRALGLAAAAATLVMAGARVVPVTAEPAFTETNVVIPASLPDDDGRPVALDAVVDVPTSGCPCPGVLLNHGFLGDKGSERDTAEALAKHGYITLRYSSRGFGQTPGQVDLVGPKERQDQLDAVHWLNDPANPVLGGDLLHDRIGQYGGSYGGMHAWALALANDPAVRTVIAAAAPTDLYQSLVPNDVMLATYANGFYATGYEPTADVVNNSVDPSKPPKQNYSQNLHRWMAEINSGVNVADAKSGLDARSVNGRWDDVHIPVFIIQGNNDGLFPTNQAIDAFQQLRRRGVPTRLYLGGIGHPPSTGSTTSPEALHVGGEMLAWLDHFLKGADNGILAQPPIEVSRSSYFGNHWDGTTRVADSYPFGAGRQLYLCATGPAGGTLAAGACADALPAVAANTYAGEGYADEPVTGPSVQKGAAGLPGGRPELKRAPGTLTYDAVPVAEGATLDLAGLPRLNLQVASAAGLPTDLTRGAAAAFQLDPKLWDVASDSTAVLVTRGAYAEPLSAAGPGEGTPAHATSFDMFGLSYQLAAGHHLRLTLSTDDAPYLRPTPNPFTVAVLAGSSITLPSTEGLHG
jgi:putative CocE/NonD family hydrolase